jgi:uncharacterized membrane protein
VSMSTAAPNALPETRVVALLRAHAWALVLSTAAFVWSVGLFLVVRDQFLHFRLARYDLGNMVQAVWSTAHGRPLEITNGATGEQMVRLGSHVDPILALLAPLWVVAPTPQLLIAVQIAAVAAGAFPLYWLGRRRAGSAAGALVALAYLAYPWTAWTAADAFHPVTLAIPLFLFCIWFLEDDRLVPFAVCAVLAATTGELMAVGIAGLGLWYAFAKGRRRAGLVIAALGVAWTAFALLVVVHAFSGGESVFYGAYGDVGGSPTGIVETAFTDPTKILSAVAESRDLAYVALLAVPLAGAFLLSPGLAAVSLPQLLANLLASVDDTTDPHAHYVAGIIPFLFAAIAVGLARLSLPKANRVAALVLTFTLAASIAGPWPGSVARKPSWEGGEAAPGALAARRAAVRLIPSDAPVSSTNRLGSFLSARRYVYSVPVIGRAEWIAVDTTDPWMPGAFGGDVDVPRFSAFLERLRADPAWTKVFEQGPVVVYRRVGA